MNSNMKSTSTLFRVVIGVAAILALSTLSHIWHDHKVQSVRDDLDSGVTNITCYVVQNGNINYIDLKSSDIKDIDFDSMTYIFYNGSASSCSVNSL